MVKSTRRTLYKRIAAATAEAFQEAVIFLPPDVKRAILRAAATETNPVAKGELSNITKNIAEAERLNVPLCQDKIGRASCRERVSIDV